MSQKNCAVQSATSVAEHRVRHLVEATTKRNPLDTMTTKTKKAPETKLFDWTAAHTNGSKLLVNSDVLIDAPLYVNIKSLKAKHLTVFQKLGSARTFFVVKEADYENNKGEHVDGAVKRLSPETLAYFCKKDAEIKKLFDAASAKAEKNAAAPADEKKPPPVVVKTEKPSASSSKPEKSEDGDGVYTMRVFDDDELPFDRLSVLLEKQPINAKTCAADHAPIIHGGIDMNGMMSHMNKAVRCADDGKTVTVFAKPVVAIQPPPKKRLTPSTSAEQASSDKKRKAPDADAGTSNVKRRRT